MSRHLNTTIAANSNCDSPAISGDGHFVVYRSSATDIVPNSSSNSVPQLFLFDRLTSTTTLLTANRFGNDIADNRSLRRCLAAAMGKPFSSILGVRFGIRRLQPLFGHPKFHSAVCDHHHGARRASRFELAGEPRRNLPRRIQNESKRPNLVEYVWFDPHCRRPRLFY